MCHSTDSSVSMSLLFPQQGLTPTVGILHISSNFPSLIHLSVLPSAMLHNRTLQFASNILNLVKILSEHTCHLQKLLSFHIHLVSCLAFLANVKITTKKRTQRQRLFQLTTWWLASFIILNSTIFVFKYLALSAGIYLLCNNCSLQSLQ